MHVRTSLCLSNDVSSSPEGMAGGFIIASNVSMAQLWPGNFDLFGFNEIEDFDSC